MVTASLTATGGLLTGVGGGGGGDVGGGEVAVGGGGGEVAVGGGGSVAVGGKVLVGGMVAVGCKVLVGGMVAVGSIGVDVGCGVLVLPPEGGASVGSFVGEPPLSAATGVEVLETVGMGMGVSVGVGCGATVTVGVGVGGNRLVLTGLLPPGPVGVSCNRAVSVAA